MTHKNRPVLNSNHYWGLGLLLIPVFFGWLYGTYFNDHVYVTYRFAQNVAAGRGLAHDAHIAGQLAPTAPLYILVLALLEPIMSQAGLLLSSLGWGSAAFVTYWIGLGEERPLSTIITASLIALIPLMPQTLGGSVPWAVALGWVAIILASTSNSRRLACWVAMLLPVGYFDVSTVLLTGLLLARCWPDSDKRLRAGWLVGFIAILGWLWFLYANWEMDWLVRPFAQIASLTQVWQNNELYLLFVPFVVLGGWVFWQNRQAKKQVQLILLWTVLVWLTGSQLTGSVTAVAALVLSGLGIEWLVNYINEQQTIPIKPISLAFFLAAPLLSIQIISLWQQYAARSIDQFALEAQLADWLNANSTPTASLYAAPNIGYRTNRATIPTDLAFDPLAVLIENEPDYIISSNTLDWHKITATGWFQERYQHSQQFQSNYAPFSPLIIWEYTPSPYDFGEKIPISAVVPERLEVVGYKYEPQVIAPGDSVYLTVYLQATQPITVGFQTQVNLTYLSDEWVWAWQRELTPRSVSGHLWQPGQIIPERFELATEETIPFGAYKLQILWNGADDGSLWPIFRDNDANVLDRILLGYVAVPPPVDDSGATAVNAQFGDQITLSGYELLSEAIPGKSVDIRLFWQALRPPDDNYFVFIHLLDADGQLVANHDEQPMNGRFATRAWQPDFMVPDSHLLQLPPDLPPGSYEVMVGLYQRETGLRLPVINAAGEEQANGSLPLAVIEIK